MYICTPRSQHCLPRQLQPYIITKLPILFLYDTNSEGVSLSALRMRTHICGAHVVYDGDSAISNVRGPTTESCRCGPIGPDPRPPDRGAAEDTEGPALSGRCLCGRHVGGRSSVLDRPNPTRRLLEQKLQSLVPESEGTV